MEGKNKKEEVKISEYSVFKPKSTRMLYEDYPELAKIKLFKDLNRFDLLFVWYYACEASPFFKISDNKTRVEECFKLTYFSGGNKKLDQKAKERYLACRFPEKIENAIEIMKNFRIGPRVRAKMIVEKAFENIEKILDIDASDEKQFLNKDNEVDYSKKKAYVDTAAKAIEILPKLITQIEESFGISDRKGSENQLEEAFEGESIADMFHEQED
jgi:hypothetical protein